jgi:uncharacterized protein (DUF1684 family)
MVSAPYRRVGYVLLVPVRKSGKICCRDRIHFKGFKYIDKPPSWLFQRRWFFEL